MSYFEKPHVTIGHESDSGVVTVTWHSFVQTETFKEALLKAVDCVDAHDTGLYLADTRQLGTLTQDSLQWVDEVWSQKAADAGLTHMGVVVPEKAIAKMAVEKGSKAAGAIDVHHFDSESDAREWLSENQVASVA